MIAAPVASASVAVETAAEYLLGQLEARRLEVALLPAPERRHTTHYVRNVESRNPAWYRHLCAEYITRRSRPRNRKAKFVDTLIKRRHVLRALREILRGGGRLRSMRNASFPMSSPAPNGCRVPTVNLIGSRRNCE